MLLSQRFKLIRRYENERCGAVWDMEMGVHSEWRWRFTPHLSWWRRTMSHDVVGEHTKPLCIMWNGGIGHSGATDANIPKGRVDRPLGMARFLLPLCQTISYEAKQEIAFCLTSQAMPYRFTFLLTGTSVMSPWMKMRAMSFLQLEKIWMFFLKRPGILPVPL